MMPKRVTDTIGTVLRSFRRMIFEMTNRNDSNMLLSPNVPIAFSARSMTFNSTIPMMILSAIQSIKSYMSLCSLLAARSASLNATALRCSSILIRAAGEAMTVATMLVWEKKLLYIHYIMQLIVKPLSDRHLWERGLAVHYTEVSASK